MKTYLLQARVDYLKKTRFLELLPDPDNTGAWPHTRFGGRNSAFFYNIGIACKQMSPGRMGSFTINILQLLFYIIETTRYRYEKQLIPFCLLSKLIIKNKQKLVSPRVEPISKKNVERLQ